MSFDLISFIVGAVFAVFAVLVYGALTAGSRDDDLHGRDE